MEGMYHKRMGQIIKYITQLLTLEVHSGSREVVLTDTQVHLLSRQKLAIHQEEQLINHPHQKRSVQILTYKNQHKRSCMMRTCDS